MDFLTIDGRGDPNAAREYEDAIEASYAKVTPEALKRVIRQPIAERGLTGGMERRPGRCSLGARFFVP